jgi:hypothetical protein
MRILFVAMLVVLTGCQTTQYYSSNPNLHMSDMPKDHKLVRTHRASNWEHYFLLNFISAHKRRDLSEKVPLEPGEQCYNLTIKNNLGPLQVITMLGLSVVTYGLSPIVWTVRNTEVSCNVAVPEAPKQEAAPTVSQ